MSDTLDVQAAADDYLAQLAAFRFSQATPAAPVALSIGELRPDLLTAMRQLPDPGTSGSLAACAGSRIHSPRVCSLFSSADW